ncbi:Protein tiptop, partial [Trachymyrmex cornetzi]
STNPLFYLFVSGEDGVEGSAPGTDLQGEEGDCVDEDGPISPSERGCAPAAKEDEDAEGTDEEDDEEASPPTPPPSATSRLNPTILRDTGPPDREPMSPRCPSRDSRESSGPATGSPPPPATRSSASPVSPSSIVPLPLGTHSLLPPHSAAVMAAYLQQTHQRLLLGHSPLSRGSVSPLVSSSCSPPAATPGLLVSPTSVGDISPSATPLPAVLDFSTRKTSSIEEDEEEQILNLSKPPTPSSSTETNNGPLDLSVSSRKRPGSEDSPPPPPRKSSRLGSTTSSTSHQETAPGVAPSGFGRPPVVSPWTSPVVATHFPYFAAAPPAALEKPYQPSEATKALEKMSELSKLGGEDLFRSSSGGGGTVTGANAPATTSSSRHSAWQSHWLNKGADQAKDVLKCVWCKQSFPTLAAMTTHMKEAKHCGVNMPVPPPAPGIHSQQTTMPTIPPPQQPHQPQTSTGNTGSNTSGTPSSKQSPSDLNLLIKETMPLPRKLVRGQDVWLGKGAEQTRQILKCMWCGQSFRSLAEMTSHMQQTQHYTNIISQEQIISWKSSDDSKGGNSTGAGGGSGNVAGGAGATSSHVSAVLTCKVCDQAFSSLKELSNHMVKNSHYKEHIMRSITESGGRRRQTREKRKKSLPVRKLLELERAQNEFKNGDAAVGLTHSLGKHAGRITCEKCGEKIETPLFVEHIRQCIGAGTVGANQRNFLKNALMSNHLPALPPTESGRKSVNEETSSISSRHHRSPSSASDATTPGKDTPTPTANETTAPMGTSPSVLNAIEKLIEKSFDSRVRHGTPGLHHAQPGAPMGTSILKRLGIDESVDYTKPLVDPQTMNLLRSYQQQHQQQHYNANAAARRERSGSEDEEDQSSYNHRRSSLHETPEDGREVLSPRMNPPTPRPTSQVEQVARSPCRNSTSSPTSSDRSVTPRGTPDTKASSSLGALSSMFDSLSGGGGGTGSGNNVDSQGRKTSSHPLAALQKLCDKTETRGPGASSTSRSGGSSAASTIGSGSGSAILAFSWACNDAVVTADSIMKCAFCDTPFISKGAYRHHLSKMHFVKDGVIPDPLTIGRSAAEPIPQANGSPSQSAASPLEESPHSKFLKYTELAKQLSSKYV